MVVFLLVVLVFLAWGILGALNRNASKTPSPASPVIHVAGAYKNFRWGMNLDDLRRLNLSGQIITGRAGDRSYGVFEPVGEHQCNLIYRLADDDKVTRVDILFPPEAGNANDAITRLLPKLGKPTTVSQNPRGAIWNSPTEVVTVGEMNGSIVYSYRQAEAQRTLPAEAPQSLFSRVMELHWGDKSPAVTSAFPGGESLVEEASQLAGYILKDGEMTFALFFELETLGLTGLQVTQHLESSQVDAGFKRFVESMTVEQGKPFSRNEKSASWRCTNFCRPDQKEGTGLTVSKTEDGVQLNWIRVTEKTIKAAQSAT